MRPARFRASFMTWACRGWARGRAQWCRWAGGAAAAVSWAGGAGLPWVQRAGVVKSLHPFAKLGGKHRTFIETHLAKSRRIGRLCGTPLPHVLTTSYLTHAPIADYLAAERDAAGRPYGYPGPLLLSPGRA